MSRKKVSTANNPSVESFQPVSALDDLEAHISERINQLHTEDEDPAASLGLPAAGDSQSVSGLIGPFETFEGFELAGLDGDARTFSGGYERVHEAYQEAGEVISSINNLSDLLTESLVNLNVRLSTLEEKLKDLSLIHSTGMSKLRQHIAEVHRAIPVQEAQTKSDQQELAQDQALVEYTNELGKQVAFLKERLDRNTHEMTVKLEEKQSALFSMLDNRLKTIERVSISYRENFQRSFFSLAVLFILVVSVAAVVISSTVDHMSAFVSHQLDALRATVHEAVESSGHQQSGTSGL